MVFLLFLASLAVVYKIIPAEVSSDAPPPFEPTHHAAMEHFALATPGLAALSTALDQAGKGAGVTPAPAIPAASGGKQSVPAGR